MNDISLFDFIDELEPEDIQMEVVAADLSMLLVHANCSRSQLATNLGCKKSRISRILSGDENLTLKTLTKVADALGYTFDVIFHNKNYDRPKQPWHIDRLNNSVPALEIHLDDHIELRVQEGNEVFEDMLAGEDASYYIRLGKTFDIDKIRSVHSDVDLSVGKKVLRLDTPISNGYTFNKSLNNKDVEQWITK